MPAFQITWTQATIATATVDVELDEIARWAIAAGAIHCGEQKRPTVEGLIQSLQRNMHLRDALLRLYATQA